MPVGYEDGVDVGNGEEGRDGIVSLLTSSDVEENN
jgi:hypothetical protein